MRRYKECINNLCRNDIPLCVEVLLCPKCEIKHQQNKQAVVSGAAAVVTDTTEVHDVGAGHSNSYVLLEQWTIQLVRANR